MVVYIDSMFVMFSIHAMEIYSVVVGEIRYIAVAQHVVTLFTRI